MELDEDLTDDTDTRLFHIQTRQFIEFLDDLAAHPVELAVGEHVILRYELADTLFPLAVQLVCRAGHLLIRACRIDTAHEDITEDSRIQATLEQLWRERKAGVLLESDHIDRDHGHLRITGFFECTAVKTDVVAGAAAASGLGDQYSGFVQVIVPTLDRMHELANDDQ